MQANVNANRNARNGLFQTALTLAVCRRFRVPVRLANPGNVVDTAVNRLVQINVAVSDLDIETAVRLGAYPGFVLYWSALAPKIRKGHQKTC